MNLYKAKIRVCIISQELYVQAESKGDAEVKLQRAPTEFLRDLVKHGDNVSISIDTPAERTLEEHAPSFATPAPAAE